MTLTVYRRKLLVGRLGITNTTSNTIYVGKPKENIMNINVKQAKDGLLLDLHDTPLLLTMEKREHN